jgi:hypothetical protein
MASCRNFFLVSVKLGIGVAVGLCKWWPENDEKMASSKA